MNSIAYESRSNQAVVLAKVTLGLGSWNKGVYFGIGSNELFMKYYTGKLSVGKNMKTTMLGHKYWECLNKALIAEKIR